MISFEDQLKWVYRQSCELNTEQRQVLPFASRHNVFISGSAGTGRTFTVKKLVKLFSINRSVAVTCTTGMACCLYSMIMH